MYTSIAPHSSILLCNHHHCPIPDHFHHPCKKPSAYWQSTLQTSPSDHSLIYLLSPMDLSVLHTSYNHTSCGLLCLTSFTSRMVLRVIHGAACSFSWLNNPLLSQQLREAFQALCLDMSPETFSAIPGGL